MALLQECLKKVNVKIKQITYRPAYDEGIHTNNMLNLLLSMIPNRNKTLSYAHGKLICGTCSSIYNKGRSAGEELGLHISFDYDNLLTARTLTFAEEDKVKKNNKKDSPVYHLEFDEKHMIERFKGCVITYAEKKKNNLYYFAQLTIAKDGSIAYKVGEPRLAHDGVITVLGENFESHEYHIPAFKKGYNENFIYCIEKDGITYNIYDTCEFVFPEMEEIHQALVRLKNVQVPVEVYHDLMDMVQSNESKVLCKQRIREYADNVSHDLFYSDIKKLGKEAPPEEKLTRKLMRLVTSKYNIKKGQDFRTAGRSEETLAACVNVHYWKQDAKLWKYCAGPNTKGNFHSINHKVYVREILSDITPDEAFVNELIYSLGDGWNKINEFSVHPSIF